MTKRGAKGKRRHAREMAIQMLYQRELGGSSLRDVVASFEPLEMAMESGETSAAELAALDAALEYAVTLARGVEEHRESIDALIREQAANWRLERMPVVDRTILRIAVYELLYQPDVPKVVILDEAIELAKRFGSESSGAFVNGILDGLLHAREFPGSLH